MLVFTKCILVGSPPCYRFRILFWFLHGTCFILVLFDLSFIVIGFKFVWVRTFYLLYVGLLRSTVSSFRSAPIRCVCPFFPGFSCVSVWHDRYLLFFFSNYKWIFFNCFLLFFLVQKIKKNIFIFDDPSDNFFLFFSYFLFFNIFWYFFWCEKNLFYFF